MDINRFKVIETTSEDTIDKIISECDSAFAFPVKMRKEYPLLLKKISKNAYFAYAYKEIVLGYIAFYANDTINAYISLIAVNPQFQGQHIGSELLKYCENKSKDKGIRNVRLEVKRENRRAISFYQNHGYQWESDKDEASIYMIKCIC